LERSCASSVTRGVNIILKDVKIVKKFYTGVTRVHEVEPLMIPYCKEEKAPRVPVVHLKVMLGGELEL
jgi:hypothetical protein